MEKFIDKDVGHKLYLCIYCFLRYYQVVMAQEYKQNLALLLDKGPFHFDRIPFGAMNASMTFQQLIEQIIEHFLEKFFHIYLNDGNIYGKAEDHLHQSYKQFGITE